MFPLFWLSTALALRQKVTSHLVVQPFQFYTIVEQLQDSSFIYKFTDNRSALQKVYRVNFIPRSGGAPKVERATGTEQFVSVELKHNVYQTIDGVELHVWAPSNIYWNEKTYQDWLCQEEVDPHAPAMEDSPFLDISKIGCKKPSYGTFLTNWQAVIAYLDTVIPTRGLIRVSNCYDQECNIKRFQSVLGYECDMHIRTCTLSLMDNKPEKNKLYAISQTLCPRKFRRSTERVVEVSPESMTLEGVITEPKDTFPTRELPLSVAAFLEEPTIVVNFSIGHHGTLLDKCFENLHCLFISSDREADRGKLKRVITFCSKESPKRRHHHWSHQLDLEAVFAEATLVVHSCDAGTAYQVVCSGRPSICVTETNEQFNNAKRLQDLGVAVAFTLEEVASNETCRKAFVMSLSKSFDETRISALQTEAKAEGTGLVACVEKMAQMFWPGRISARFWFKWLRVFWQMVCQMVWPDWSHAWRRWRR